MRAPARPEASAARGLRPVLVAGPQGSGKTSLLRHLVRALKGQGEPAPAMRYLKVDCHASTDDQRMAELGLAAELVLAGDHCPDHALVEPLTQTLVTAWTAGEGWLFVETAGLCDRCSPFITEALSLLVFDALKSVHAPSKMRVPIRGADLVVLTKAELVSPAEAEILIAMIRRVNPRARVLRFNGLDGEGLERVLAAVFAAPVVPPRPVLQLRQALPGGWCDTCQRGLQGPEPGAPIKGRTP